MAPSEIQSGSATVIDSNIPTMEMCGGGGYAWLGHVPSTGFEEIPLCWDRLWFRTEGMGLASAFQTQLTPDPHPPSVTLVYSVKYSSILHYKSISLELSCLTI